MLLGIDWTFCAIHQNLGFIFGGAAVVLEGLTAYWMEHVVGGTP